MCIIIDTNQIVKFFNQPEHEDMKPVHRWIRTTGRLLYSTGDNFERELKNSAKPMLRELSRAGHAVHVSDRTVSQEANRLRESDLELKSPEDCHVLALARITKTRLLFTRDQKLHADFKNPNIIKGGTIYQNKSHKGLLDRLVCKRKNRKPAAT